MKRRHENHDRCAYDDFFVSFSFGSAIGSFTALNENFPVCGDVDFPRILSVLVTTMMISSPSSLCVPESAPRSLARRTYASRCSWVKREVSAFPGIFLISSFGTVYVLSTLRKGIIRQSSLPAAKCVLLRMRLCLSRGATCSLTGPEIMEPTVSKKHAYSACAEQIASAM